MLRKHRACWRPELLSALFFTVSDWFLSWQKSGLKQPVQFIPFCLSLQKVQKLFFIFFPLYKATLRNLPLYQQGFPSQTRLYIYYQNVIFGPFSIMGAPNCIIYSVAKVRKKRGNEENPFMDNLHSIFFSLGKGKTSSQLGTSKTWIKAQICPRQISPRVPA